MVFLAYALYAVLVVYAISRIRESQRLPGATLRPSAVALAMLVWPPSIAAALAILFMQDVLGPAAFLGIVLGGLGVAATGWLLGRDDGPWPFLLRLVGWSVFSGALLLPAHTALLAPIAGLLGLLVPGAGSHSRSATPDGRTQRQAGSKGSDFS